MHKIAYLAALIGMILVTSAAQAKPPKSLAECYDLVIAHCNTQAHPQACASHGMDDCDEIFPIPLVLDPGKARLGLTIGD